jgi:hypothetical protein
MIISEKYPIHTKEIYDAPPFQDSLSAFRFDPSITRNVLYERWLYVTTM